MVLRGNPMQDFCSRENWENAHQERYMRAAQDFSLDRHSTVDSSTRDWKECSKIPVKDFVLHAVLQNGEERTYSSSNLTPFQDKIITDEVRRRFLRELRRSSRIHPQVANHNNIFPANEFGFDNSHEDRKHSSSGESSGERTKHRHHESSRSEDSDDGPEITKKRRIRLFSSRHRVVDENSLPMIPSVELYSLEIGNEQEVKKFYQNRFKDMQQSACKIIGKAFVKLIEPRKQTNYPYTKGDSMAPPWWPATKGTENYIRHKEPDHLLKDERICLLLHILRMIVEPNANHHVAFQKLGLSVKKLEEHTMEQMSNWFTDPDHPENASKRVYLAEIFKVARAEERFKIGGTDATTQVKVTTGECLLAEESEDEGDRDIKVEDERIITGPVHSASASHPSSGTISPLLIPNTNDVDQSVSLYNQPNSTRPIPVRYSAHPGQMEEHPQQPSYADSSCFPRSGVPLGFQSRLPVEGIRRFNSPTYQTSQSVYGWDPGTTTTMVSSGSTMANCCYTTSPQTSMGSQQTQFQLPPPNTQQQQQQVSSMLPPRSMTTHLSHNHYNAVPSPGRHYDATSSLGGHHTLRTGSLGHSPMTTGFGGYMTDGGNTSFGSNHHHSTDNESTAFFGSHHNGESAEMRDLNSGTSGMQEIKSDGMGVVDR